MVAARADTPGLHAELIRDGQHPQAGVAEQGQISFDAVRVSAEHPDHLVADFGRVDRGKRGVTAQQLGDLRRAGLATQVGNDGVGVQDGHAAPACRLFSLSASALRSAARASSAFGPGVS